MVCEHSLKIIDNVRECCLKGGICIEEDCEDLKEAALTREDIILANQEMRRDERGTL
jgi:hypothetical protein